MKKICTENKLFDETRHLKKAAKIGRPDQANLSSIVEYIVETHGIKTMQPYFHQNLDDLIPKINAKTRTIGQDNPVKKILELIGVKYVDRWSRQTTEAVKNPKRIFYRIRDEENNAIRVTNYTDCIPYVNLFVRENDIITNRTYQLSIDSVNISLHPNQAIIEIKFISSNEKLSFDLSKAIDSLVSKWLYHYSEIPPERMSYVIANNTMKARIDFRTLELKRKNNRYLIREFNANFLIGWK